MTTKTIVRPVQKTWKSQPTMEGAGVHLKRAFGFQEMPGLDPFLLMDDFRSENPKDYQAGFLGQIGVPFPTLSAIAVTGAELLGGLALVAGLFTRWAALPLAFSMAVAAVTVHLKDGFFLPNGVEYVLTLFLASIALVLTGSGSFSVDRLLEKRAQEKSPVEAGRPYPATVEVR